MQTDLTESIHNNCDSAFNEHNYANVLNNTNNKPIDYLNVNTDGWQTVMSSTKRPINEGPKSLSTSKKSRQGNSNPNPNPNFAVETNNRFEAISEPDQMDENTTTSESQAREPKPPPIFIPDVMKVNDMVQSIEAVIPKDSYTYKCLERNKIKINPVTVEAYRKLVHKLKELNINFHTYQIKQDKAYRVVLKNMHFSTDVSDIRSALETHGFRVRNITNARQYKTKLPLSMFFVDLEPNANNKEIYNLKFLLNAKITFEPPHKRTDIVQCKKCQQYGHTKTYCWLPFKCVKCGQGHNTLTCTKPTTTPPKCALCDGDHPANYKGCAIYRELKRKSSQNLTAKPATRGQAVPAPQRIREQRPTSPSPSGQASPKRTYAQVISNTNTAPEGGNNLNETLHNFFSKFEKLMLQQAEQIGTLMNLLSTVVSKLK